MLDMAKLRTFETRAESRAARDCGAISLGLTCIHSSHSTGTFGEGGTRLLHVDQQLVSSL